MGRAGRGQPRSLTVSREATKVAVAHRANARASAVRKNRSSRCPRRAAPRRLSRSATTAGRNLKSRAMRAHSCSTATANLPASPAANTSPSGQPSRPTPDTAKADTPAGLTVEVKPPVGGLTNPVGLSSADVENTTVALPDGVAINPGQAAGLEACTSADRMAWNRCPTAKKTTGRRRVPTAPKSASTKS